MQIPVYYEIDSETQEATGTVHPFCSDQCRTLFIVAFVMSNPPDVSLKPGTNDISWHDEQVCSQCGGPLEPGDVEPYG